MRQRADIQTFITKLQSLTKAAYTAIIYRRAVRYTFLKYIKTKCPYPVNSRDCGKRILKEQFAQNHISRQNPFTGQNGKGGAYHKRIFALKYYLLFFSSLASLTAYTIRATTINTTTPYVINFASLEILRFAIKFKIP